MVLSVTEEDTVEKGGRGRGVGLSIKGVPSMGLVEKVMSGLSWCLGKDTPGREDRAASQPEGAQAV